MTLTLNVLIKKLHKGESVFIYFSFSNNEHLYASFNSSKRTENVISLNLQKPRGWFRSAASSHVVFLFACRYDGLSGSHKADGLV